MAIVIRTNGTKEELPNTELSTLQEAVGGYIEHVPSETADIFVDEEGLLKGKELNQAGSILAGTPLVGDVVVAELGEVK